MSESAVTKIYILGNNQTGASWYFTDVELARKALAAKAKKCRYAPGVGCFKEEPDGFAYVFGWEEVLVWWRIKEVAIVQDVAEILGVL